MFPGADKVVVLALCAFVLVVAPLTAVLLAGRVKEGDPRDTSPRATTKGAPQR